jgi:hypothetical protein
MGIGLLFWVLMIIWLVFGFMRESFAPNVSLWGNTVLLFILFALLGWAVFGPALHG